MKIFEIIEEPLQLFVMTMIVPLIAISYHRVQNRKKKELVSSQVPGESMEGYASYAPVDYIIPVGLATILVFTGLLALLGFIEYGVEGKESADFLTMGIKYETKFGDYYTKSLAALMYGFAGAYIFSLSNLLRRYCMRDLPPRAFHSVTLRIIFACGVALAIRYLWESILTGEGHYLPALFFFVGMFPESGLHFIRKTFKSRLGDKEKSMEVQLSTIDGLSIFHQFRLQEEGIDTVQNLATSDPIDLAIKTRFTFQTIQDWIAQAKLCLLFPNHIKKFKEIGIRTIHDFITLHQEKRLADIAKVVDIPAEVLIAAAAIQEKKEKSGKVPQEATQ
jgi:hypothetical protein